MTTEFEFFKFAQNYFLWIKMKERGQFGRFKHFFLNPCLYY